jgi:F-type H+-transporting ATPase subunit b
MEALGINPILIVAQMISFAIVYFLFSRFLYPRIRKALEERRAAIDKTFADQAAIETRLKEFDIEQKAAQKKASEDMQRVLAEAKESAAATKRDLVAKAKEAADAEFETAKKRIEQEKLAAESEVAQHAKTIAQSIVKELLTEKAADAKWQQSQIQAGINALKQSNE